MNSERIKSLIDLVGTDISGKWMSIDNVIELAKMSYGEGHTNLVYPEFKDWFEEIENYGLRLERFYDEFQALDRVQQERMIEWLEAAWHCARMTNENG